MLVLTRRPKEAVVVGQTGGRDRLLTITVLEVNGAKVRLGFDIDAKFPVHRLEVWQRIATNRQTVSDPPGTRPS